MIKYPLETFLSFTTKCNLKCKHCYSNSGIQGKTINYKKILIILKKIRPLRLVISGGEPVLEISKLVKFLDNYKNKYKISTYIVLATNGILLNKSNLKKLKPFIDRFQISLDTVSRTKFGKLRGVDLFDQTIKGIKNAKKAGFDIQIAFSIFKENLNEVKGIVSFCKKNKIDKLNVLRQRPLGRSKTKVTPKEIKKTYQTFLKLSKGKEIKLSIHDPIADVLGIKSECIAAKEIIAINIDGNFKPCPLFNKSINGNFNSAWNSNFFRKVRKNIKGCKSCKFDSCNGGCKSCSWNLFDKSGKDPWCLKKLV